MAKCSDATLEKGDTVIMGEPVIMNPNSYTTLQQVLKHIQDQSRITAGSRKWGVVGLDGLPYVLAQRPTLCGAIDFLDISHAASLTYAHPDFACHSS